MHRARRWLRLTVGLTRVFIHLSLAFIIIASSFRWLGPETRRRLVHWWSIRVLRICGMTVRVTGSTLETRRGVMLVLNHISWTDIYAIHAIRPARFVAKSEIRRWPIVGYLCDRTGTIFIERGRRHAVHQANQNIAQMLRDGDLVGIFPEGTTSDGLGLLPFHANLIQAAIDAGAPVQPVALRYFKPRGGIAHAASYVGDTSLFESICMIIVDAPIIVRATILPAIETTGLTRHQVAQQARVAIAASLGVDTLDREAAIGADLQGELL